MPIDKPLKKILVSRSASSEVRRSCGWSKKTGKKW